MTDQFNEGLNTMDISRDSDYLEDDVFDTDTGSGQQKSEEIGYFGPKDLAQDRDGQAWREIEKYRERRELELILKDDLYADLDVNGVWE